MDLFFVLGVLLVVPVLYFYGQSHNQPTKVWKGDIGMACAYCHVDFVKGQRLVNGHKGWGHVECVPKIRRRIFNRW